jgi:hypothetical protein
MGPDIDIGMSERTLLKAITPLLRKIGCARENIKTEMELQGINGSRIYPGRNRNNDGTPSGKCRETATR